MLSNNFDTYQTLMKLVEQVLSQYYTKPIGNIDFSSVSNSGTGYCYSNIDDNYQIVRIINFGVCIGYQIQISLTNNNNDEMTRGAILFTYRNDKLGFNYDGPKVFYHHCYVESTDIRKVIENFSKLIEFGHVDLTNEKYDYETKKYVSSSHRAILADLK